MATAAPAGLLAPGHSTQQWCDHLGSTLCRSHSVSLLSFSIFLAHTSVTWVAHGILARRAVAWSVRMRQDAACACAGWRIPDDVRVCGRVCRFLSLFLESLSLTLFVCLFVDRSCCPSTSVRRNVQFEICLRRLVMLHPVCCSLTNWIQLDCVAVRPTLVFSSGCKSI
jgi:hypothetical protein